MERYKLRDFNQWAKKEGLKDDVLCETLEERNRGFLGDRIGSFIYKKRIGLSGRGKRGGARTIVLFKKAELVLFIYGYSKNEKSNLETREEKALRLFAKDFMELSFAERMVKVKNGTLLVLGGKNNE